jgi:hypothetical protein
MRASFEAPRICEQMYISLYSTGGLKSSALLVGWTSKELRRFYAEVRVFATLR